MATIISEYLYCCYGNHLEDLSIISHSVLGMVVGKVKKKKKTAGPEENPNDFFPLPVSLHTGLELLNLLEADLFCDGYADFSAKYHIAQAS